MRDHYPFITPRTEGFIMGKHEPTGDAASDEQHSDSRTYGGGKLEATNKAKGNVSSGRPAPNPKHAKD